MAKLTAAACALIILMSAAVAVYPGASGSVPVMDFCKTNGFTAKFNLDLAYISITRSGSTNEVRVFINMPYVVCGRSIRYMSGGIVINKSGGYELPAEYAAAVRGFFREDGGLPPVDYTVAIVTNKVPVVTNKVIVVQTNYVFLGSSSSRLATSSVTAVSSGGSSSRKDESALVTNYTGAHDNFKPITAIVLDAGHGGKDPGGLGVNGTKEKEIVLSIATMLLASLKAKGFSNVVMTRKTDVFLSLDERTKISAEVSRRYNAIFVSVHGNISLSRSVDGVEVYSLADAASDADAQLVEANENAPFLKDIEKTEAIYSIISDLVKDELRRESEMLSTDVARAMIKVMGVPLRGVKKANFYVLKYNQVPSILVEVGFLSNGAESKKLLNKTYQQKTASGIADGIVQFIEKYNKSRGFTR